MNTQPPTARSPRYTLSIRGPRPDAAATTLARDVPALELTAAMRAVHLRGDATVATYEIQAVLPVEGRRALDLACEVIHGD